ncbi:hypothetical protein D8B24_21625, partial [Verminephrobacter aporrectodeae subsp. tuberculatae]|uniref:hemagglutinin repeat-containing protein n=1 Tax=Verminephrobacter aporrectodeae TaxID=1110389 RepID=UPI002242E97B
MRLSAGGNMLVSGGSVMATGSSLSAGKDLSIEANDGHISLNALSNAARASVDRITLSAGEDLKVSAFKGSLFATGLQASGRNISLATATNGEKVRLSAGSNMLVSGGSVMATGSNLSAGKNLTIEANNGPISLNALSNAAGASVERITLSAGDDLKVSAFKGSLFATGLQANGRNISLASTGTTRVASSTAYVGSNVVAVSSELSASEGITLAS